MESCGYEIKQGKHIAFRSKNQQRFTRAKTIGDNYTEERTKERILNKDKELGNIIDIKNNNQQRNRNQNQQNNRLNNSNSNNNQR